MKSQSLKSMQAARPHVILTATSVNGDLFQLPTSQIFTATFCVAMIRASDNAKGKHSTSLRQ